MDRMRLLVHSVLPSCSNKVTQSALAVPLSLTRAPHASLQCGSSPSARSYEQNATIRLPMFQVARLSVGRNCSNPLACTTHPDSPWSVPVIDSCMLDSGIDIVTLSVYALYQQNKLLLGILLSFFGLDIIASITVPLLSVKHVTRSQDSGCNIAQKPVEYYAALYGISNLSCLS